MADLTLRGQCEEAKRLARTGDPHEAISICRRIITTFPKHVTAYGILAHILLQLGEHDQALHLFQRVLSADPEDPQAFAGIAAIFEERGLFDEAVWYLERALEIAPGDRDARAKLRALLAERGRGAPEGAPLTRAALARAWMRGQIHSRAADELAELVAEEPQRYDLRTALVEALWRDRQYALAATEAQTLLSELPNCLKANLVLGQVWLGGERDEEARALLRRAQALDPDNAAAQTLFGYRSPLPPRVSRLPGRDDSIPPLDLPYSLEDDEPLGDEDVIEGRAIAMVPGAPDGDTSPEALWDQLRSALAWRGSVTSAPTLQAMASEEDGEPAGDTPAEPTPESRPPEEVGVEAPAEAPPEAEPLPQDGLSLLDVRRRYVEEHPEDYVARLDLARRYRDVGNIAAALEQYNRLAMEDYSTLHAVVDDLDRLNRIYLRTPAIETLLARARLRDSLKPPQRSS